MLEPATTRENLSLKDYAVLLITYSDKDYDTLLKVSLSDPHVRLRLYNVDLFEL